MSKFKKITGIFDSDMSWGFPPVEWMKMRHQLEIIQPYVEKIITFEAPHFLNSNSMFPSAKTLHKRYMDYIQQYNSKDKVSCT